MVLTVCNTGNFNTDKNFTVMKILFTLLTVCLVSFTLQAQLTTKQITDLVFRTADSVRKEKTAEIIKQNELLRREYKAADTTNLKDKGQSDSLAVLFKNMRSLDPDTFLDSNNVVYIKSYTATLQQLIQALHDLDNLSKQLELLKPYSNYIDEKIKPWINSAPKQ